jgi:hypothetical protein
VFSYEGADGAMGLLLGARFGRGLEQGTESLRLLGAQVVV